MRYKHLLAFIAIALGLSSCSKSIDEIIEPTEKKTVEFFTRTAPTVNIEYPVTLYAFKCTGELVESAIAKEEGVPLQLQIPAGSYKFTALAGAKGLSSVASPTLNTGIGIPEDGLITTPIQMGHADLSIGATNTEVTITMTYQVAKVDVELYNIPTDATEVSVTLSTLNADKAFSGAWLGESTVIIPLTQTEETTTWKSDTTYILPGVGSKPLVVGISVTAGDQKKVYSYTHTSNLTAGTPYTLKGSYDGEVNINGTISAEGWNNPVEISFSFGSENINNGGNDNNGNNGGTPSEFPEAFTLWNELFVAKVTPINDITAELLLLNRLEEWTSVSKTDINDIVNSYTEKNVSDWRVPTEEELTYLSTNYTSINDVISSIGKKLTGSYFCNDGVNYVTMGSTNVGNAESGKFKLRLVKTVTITKAQ